jgi:hypothetical protein
MSERQHLGFRTSLARPRLQNRACSRDWIKIKNNGAPGDRAGDADRYEQAIAQMSSSHAIRPILCLLDIPALLCDGISVHAIWEC